MPGSYLRKPASQSDCGSQSADWIRDAIDAAGRFLPQLRPLSHYDHDHPLRPLMGIDFDEALAKIADLYGVSCYQSLETFAGHCRSGRIRRADLAAVLAEAIDGDDAWGADHANPLLAYDLGTRNALRLNMLVVPEIDLTSGDSTWIETLCDAHDETEQAIDAPELLAFQRWVETLSRASKPREADLLLALRVEVNNRPCGQWDSQAWQRAYAVALRFYCQRAVDKWQPGKCLDVARCRNILLGDEQAEITGRMAAFCRAFADPGLASWSLPDRERGFYQAFLTVFSSTSAMFRLIERPWQRALSELARRQREQKISASESIEQFVRWGRLGEREARVYVQDALNSVRGWAGLLQQLAEGDLPRPTAMSRFDLMEFVAVVLLMDRTVLSAGLGGAVDKSSLGSLSLSRQRECWTHNVPLKIASRRYWLYRLVRRQRWSPMQLSQLLPMDWSTLHHELNSFSPTARKIVLQTAYEKSYREQMLDMLVGHMALRPSQMTLKRPAMQLLCCAEPCEESYRRHVEETGPEVVTYGVPGFFDVDMVFKAATTVHSARHVPANVNARHLVEETYYQANVGHSNGHCDGQCSEKLSVSDAADSLSVRLGSASARQWHRFADWLAATVGGTVGAKCDAGDLAARPCMDRASDAPKAVGYSIEEMASVVARLLEDAGLTKNFARLIVVMGHESTSVNNLFERADNCSFCGKQSGRANARAFVQMANDLRVRQCLKRGEQGLQQSGLDIPEDCQFVAAIRNSCSETLEFLDLHRLPPSHADDFRAASSIFMQASGRNAQERCRQFESDEASSEERALAHCDDRSRGGATARAECSAAGNALCIIGPREWTRGLNLDGRAFLLSYDSAADNSDLSILTRLLKVVMPVLARVNLDYYFSAVAPEMFGAGPQSLLNIEAQLGVSNASVTNASTSSGDLRTGLPLEMVARHEPMRLLIVINASPAAMQVLLQEQPSIRQQFDRRHMQLMLMHEGQLHSPLP